VTPSISRKCMRCFSADFTSNGMPVVVAMVFVPS